MHGNQLTTETVNPPDANGIAVSGTSKSWPSHLLPTLIRHAGVPAWRIGRKGRKVGQD